MNGEKSRRSFLRNTAIAGGAAAAGLSGITSARSEEKTPAAIEKIMKTKDDLELLSWINNNLNTCVVCDSLDDLGIPVRAMDGRIRPLHPDFAFVGRARTVLWRDLYEP
ncbi:MAG: twin-arginine translocation signal domain-containing protein, partial [Candidatus Latescibacteria bacterium]|nr:twin-arginine translocation signal domain-containing protein [Candidatus Latescibacterota bacterium]